MKFEHAQEALSLQRRLDYLRATNPMNYKNRDIEPALLHRINSQFNDVLTIDSLISQLRKIGVST